MRTTTALITSMAAVGLFALSGCTLLRTDTVECETTSQCRIEFGYGSTCGGDGFCRNDLNPRCNRSFPDDLLFDPEKVESHIVIGTLMDLNVEAQRGREKSAQLAAQQANDSMGIDGKQFGVVLCNVTAGENFPAEQRPDDLSRTDASVEAAKYLADVIGVPAVVGPSASSDTEFVFNALMSKNVLVISPSATSPALTNKDGMNVSDEAPGLLWRTAPSDTLQGEAIADDMKGDITITGRTQPVNKVALVYQIGAYGEGLREAFMANFPTADIIDFSYENATEAADRASMAGQSDADEVLFISSTATEIADFVRGTNNSVSYNSKGIFLTDAAANATLLAIQSPRFSQIRGSRPAPPAAADPVYEAFQMAYQTEYEGESIQNLSYTSNSYDAAWLVLYGISWAIFQEQGVINGTTIARGIRRVSNGNSPPIEIRLSSWTSVKDAFAAGLSVNVKGASGHLDYDLASEEILRSDIDVWRIRPLATDPNPADMIRDEIVSIYRWTPDN